MSLKANIALSTLLCFCLLPAALGAEQVFSANDLEAAKIAATVDLGGFTILATAEKGVTVEAMTEPRTAPDGEIFNNRIKLNGGGGTEFRAVKITVKENAKVGIYLSSSSGTDARILKVTDAAGTAVAELAAPPDDKINSGYVTVTLPKAGEYLFFSAASGINIYAIVVR